MIATPHEYKLCEEILKLSGEEFRKQAEALIAKIANRQNQIEKSKKEKND